MAASKFLAPSAALLRSLSAKPVATSPLLKLSSLRPFTASSRLLDTAASAATIPIRRPIGAFRGGLFGFLLGSSSAGAAVYYYILDGYKVSNELLTEDIYALQAAVQKTHAYLTTLEEKFDAATAEMQQKKKRSS